MLQDQYDERFHNITTSCYPIPVDEVEIKRSELLHKTMRTIWGGDFVSPIERELRKGNDFKVLDVGCGSGVWTLQLSEDYPLAKFIGLDRIPIFPKEVSQKNLQFIQGDILKGLPFEDNSFDFIHMRMLIIAFTQIQWNEIVIKELIRVCKPGGWIEIVDFDIDGKYMGPVHKRIFTFFTKYLESNGINCLISDELPELIENTDQVDSVYTDEIYCGIGEWGGESGRLTLEAFVTILHGLKEEMLKLIGIDEDEYEMMISQYLEEIRLSRSYCITIRFYCQKIA